MSSSLRGRSSLGRDSPITLIFLRTLLYHAKESAAALADLTALTALVACLSSLGFHKVFPSAAIPASVEADATPLSE